MSEICINCVHQEVCRYECYCPSGHCNDYAVADDFIPHGEWIEEDDDNFFVRKCSNCNEVAEWLDGGSQFLSNYCPNCGAKMKAAQNENR